MKFHAKEKKLDFVRRRRWLLKMVPTSGKIDGFSCTLPPVLRVQLKAKVMTTNFPDNLDQKKSLCKSRAISCNVNWKKLLEHTYLVNLLFVFFL